MSTPSAKVRTRKSPQQRSREIRDVALEIAREQGLSALTQRAVAARAGVASGLVAHYAGSMEDLVAEAFREVTAAELADVRSDVETVGSAASKLARLIETTLDSGHDDVSLVWVDAWSLGRGSRALAEAIDEQMTAWQGLIAEVVEGGNVAGDFATEDVAAVAWQILAMVDGLTAHALTRGTAAQQFAWRLAQASEVLVGAPAGSITSELRPGRV